MPPLCGEDVTAPAPWHPHPSLFGAQVPREPVLPALPVPSSGHPSSLPSFLLLLWMARSCSRSSPTFRFSQQEALPAGGDTEGLTPRVLRDWGPRAPQGTSPACAEHPPDAILRDTAASSNLVQLSCSSRSSRSWGWARSHEQGTRVTPRELGGQAAPQLRDTKTPGGASQEGVAPYPGFHQQLPRDGEHSGEAKWSAHCGWEEKVSPGTLPLPGPPEGS